MSMDADTIVDRRRLRRKLTTWRVVAFLLATIAVVGGVYLTVGRELNLGSRPGAYVARVKISGIIRGDSERVEALDRLAKSTTASAVIVHVDSPGGTTAGSEQLFDALRRVADRKPMVMVVDSLAASGGYIVAMAGDHIIAQGTSIVGSIGVLFQYPNVAELMKTLGIKVEEIKSSPLKAAPNGFEPTSPEAREAIAALVRDSYGWFRGLVSSRRKIDGDALERVADGRVFTGRQGLELKLVDQLGDEKTAIAWLAKERGVSDKLPVRDFQLKDRFSDLSFLHLGAAAVLDAVGLKDLAARFATAGTLQTIEKLNLDGLLALWHPSATN
jgi:protease-4